MHSSFNNIAKAISDYRGGESSDDSALNDQTIFTRLYDRYAPLMLGVITKTVSNRAEAVLILEQSFVTIRQQLDELKTGKQPLFVYLLKIARRTASDALAKQRQPGSSSLQLTGKGSLAKVSQQKNSPSSIEPMQENGLDTQQKMLLNDVLFHNCTPEEAAASAGIPASQARQQLRLAIQQLRNLPLKK